MGHPKAQCFHLSIPNDVMWHVPSEKRAAGYSQSTRWYPTASACQEEEEEEEERAGEDLSKATAMNVVDAGREKGCQTANMRKIGDRGAAREQHSRVLIHHMFTIATLRWQDVRRNLLLRRQAGQAQQVDRGLPADGRCHYSFTSLFDLQPYNLPCIKRGLQSRSLPYHYYRSTSFFDLQEGTADRVSFCFQQSTLVQQGPGGAPADCLSTLHMTRCAKGVKFNKPHHHQPSFLYACVRM